jgi:PAS domain S-box-containing protein
MTSRDRDTANTEDAPDDGADRYLQLYNRTPMALHSVDGDARIIEVNDHWLTLFGYRRDEVLGRSPPDFMVVESARLYRERAWPDMLGSTETIRTFDYRFVKRSGEIFDGRLSSRGERGADGRLIRTWAATVDITAEKRAEAHLLQAQKMEVVGQLTGGIAHDFNNLLTAIIGNLDLLARETKDNPKAAGRTKAALHAADRAAKLTEQLLAFSRKQHLRPEALNLNASIARMGDLLARTMGGVVTIRTQCEPLLWPVSLDPTQIELVILNLAINARDAMPSGGTVTIETVNIPRGSAAIPPEWGKAMDAVGISLSDTGTGMDAATLAKVFEPFFTTKDIGKGSGLGLSQVHGVVQQSGGTIRIESQPGAGTTVRLYFPRAAEMPLAQMDETRPLATDFVGRVLVVDDDADVREITVQMLRYAGYRVTEADGGQAALEALEGDAVYDLVIVDVAMAGVNGFETVRRARAKRPELRVLFVTGYAETSALHTQAGHDPLIKKPFAVAELVEAVRQALQRGPLV